MQVYINECIATITMPAMLIQKASCSNGNVDYKTPPAQPIRLQIFRGKRARYCDQTEHPAMIMISTD